MQILNVDVLGIIFETFSLEWHLLVCHNDTMECFMKLTNEKVCKLGIPHYHTSDGFYICSASGLVFTDFDGINNCIKNMHIIP